MKKRIKLAHLEGAVVGFNVETPMSGVGEQEQYAVILITGVYRAKSNGKYYVKGVNLKRQTNSADVEFRQYQIDRIINRTLVVISDNSWSRTDPYGQSLRRLGQKGVRKYTPEPTKWDAKKGIQKLRDKVRSKATASM